MTEPFIDTELPCSQFVRRSRVLNGSRAGMSIGREAGQSTIDNPKCPLLGGDVKSAGGGQRVHYNEPRDIAPPIRGEERGSMDEGRATGDGPEAAGLGLRLG